MSVADAVRNGADVLDASDTFDPEIRKQYVNASEAFTCIRKQWYAKNDAETDGPENWGYARRGKWGEDYIVSRLRAANVPMLFTGEDQVQIQDDERRVSCTPDGLISAEWFGKGAGWVATEFKTIDPRTNRSKLPKEEHIRQVQIAAAMFNDNLAEFPELGGEQVVACCVVYMDASNFDDIVEMMLPLKPAILDQMAGRVNRIMDAKQASRLPREGVKSAFQAECKQRCNFNGVCKVSGASSSEGQGVKGGGDAAVQVERYLNAKAAASHAKKLQDEAGERLKSVLKKEGVASLEVDGHSIALGQRAGSVSYAKVVKEHLPDVDLEPYRGAPSETLTVK